MSLKGYEWLRDGKVVAWFTFKYRTLYITQEATAKDIADFKEYIKNQVSFDILHEEHV